MYCNFPYLSQVSIVILDSFRFDINWLKLKYRDMKKVKYMELSDQQIKVIEGVHKKRDYHKGLLAKKPSETDYCTLEEAYNNLLT